MSINNALYLGLDFSTQQLKAVAIDDSLNIRYEESVLFEADLPEFGTVGGVTKGNDGCTVTAPTLMWVKALDLLLQRLQSKQLPFQQVLAVSGCGQQHGSVYWRKGAEETLKNLRPSESLADQLEDCYSIGQSPVWMDSSTTAQCRRLEQECGGAELVAKKTGSRAYERFTGNQIAKLYCQDPASLEATERISLVSSFGASLLCGFYAPIDLSDGSGMNLLDIESKDWWLPALSACCPNLAQKLDHPVPSSSVVGYISKYFVQKYGFPAGCKVVAFTGDNPSSLAGMCLQEGDTEVSLGTSDTVFLWVSEANPQLMGHVFVNPVDQGAYMALLCYKNGSQARERVRDMCVMVDVASPDEKWVKFNELMDSTPPGNNGQIGLYYFDPEITPSVQGIYRYYSDDRKVESSFPPAVEVRAVVEGQFLAKYIHARTLGYKILPSSRILATGGACQNLRILQVLANVFDRDVFILKGMANSASLGAAYRAKHGAMSPDTLFSVAVAGGPQYTLAVRPQPNVHQQVYLPMADRLAKLLDQLPPFQE